MRKKKWPTELGDALLIAAAAATLALFGFLYVMLPPTTIETHSAVQTTKLPPRNSK